MGRSDNDYQEEIREHIAMETRANIDRGMSPEEAARAARVTFGSVAGTRQELYEGRTSYWWSTLTQDFRYAARAIRRNLLLSCIVVLILSIGIGMTTAVFSLLNAVAFKPPVSVDSDSFVRLLGLDRREGGQSRNIASMPAYERLRADSPSLRELAAWSGYFYLNAPLGSGDVRKADGLLTSCNFFSVFNDDPPRLGRFFHESDCSSAQPVTILSERIWRDRFGADPGIVGKSIPYGGRPLTVIGVAVPPKLVEESAPDLWVPYTLQPYLKDFGIFANRDWMRGDFQWLQLAGRLQPGTTRQAAAAELKVLWDREQPRDPTKSRDLRLTDGSLWSMSDGDILWFFGIALAFPTVIAFIVCATVATLLLSRAVGRQKEMAIRVALGGGRRRLLQMLLAESLLLASAAGILGLLFVFTIPGALIDFLSITNAAPFVPSPDWRVFVYMGLVTILMAVLAGLTPALESLNAQLGESLKGREGFGKRRGQARLRQVLAGAQVTFSMVLLVAAGSLLRAETRQASTGFETRQVAFAQLQKWGAQSPIDNHAALAASLKSLPGVQSVALANSIPGVFEWQVSLDLPDNPGKVFLAAAVSPEVFQTFDIPIVEGRNFPATDSQASAEEPVLVSQQFVRRWLPNQNPLGQVLQVSGEATRLRIVGVARDRATTGTSQADKDASFVYRPMKPQGDVYVFARFEGNAAAFSMTLQSALKAQTGAILSVRTIQSLFEERMAGLRSIRTLVVGLGAIGLTLALIGLYGVVSFTAAQRKKDFAIRVALGAGRQTIFRSVIKSGMRPMPIALLAGLGLSFAALKVVDSARGLVPVGGISGDPVPYLAAASILLAAIFGALAVPAYRAMASDPVDALRDE
jgi:macrolide transport system ATP-binding/permease protein